MTHTLRVDDTEVEVDRKAVKHLRIIVYAPHGRVRVATPLRVSDAAVRRAVGAKLDWIKRQQSDFLARDSTPPREPRYRSGEAHPLWGRDVTLEVVTLTDDGRRRGRVERRADGRLLLFAPPRSTVEQRRRLLDDWYREQLKTRLPALFERWQPAVGVRINDWRIRKMRTRWGTCNITDRRIWINLELAKKPLSCLEYVVVHELTHLHERYHNARFWRRIERVLPNWREAETLLETG